jgi:hypothetical protein
MTGQPAGQDPMQSPAQSREPKSIRDYLSIARSQGQVPTFTNRPGGQGYQVEDQQAIAEGPQSQYEKTPFAQRMKMSPYVRAQERVKTLLPGLWDQMFQGMEQGAILDDYQMKAWNGAVGQLTSNLLKQFDKQYEWTLKNEVTQRGKREKDRQYWQKDYITQKSRGSVPVHEDTGQPYTESEYVEERISVADEMRFKAETAEGERGQGTAADLSPQEVGQILQNNPELGRSIKHQVMMAMTEHAGRQVTEGEFSAMVQDPAWKQIINDATSAAIEDNYENIRAASGK